PGGHRDWRGLGGQCLAGHSRSPASDTDPVAYASPHANADASPHSNAHAHTSPNANPHASPDTNAHAATDAFAHPLANASPYQRSLTHRRSDALGVTVGHRRPNLGHPAVYRPGAGR